MRVFQSTYKDRQGQTQKTKAWYVEFTDHTATVRRAPGFTDRRQTEALGRRMVDLVSLRVAGATLPPDVSKWIEALSPKLRGYLARIGLLDTGRVAAMRPLREHLDGAADAPGYRQHLAAKGDTAEYVEKACARARAVMDGCRFIFWSDIAASKVMAYLDDLRADKVDAEGKVTKRGKSAQTFNYYLGAFKGFCRWMVRDGRATESPVAHLTGLNVKTDRRRVRRALSVEEIRWLLAVTDAPTAPERYGMSGPARAMLYRLAVETGFRRGELASLTRASFRLDGERPTVTVEAAYSKHRREDTLPLRPDTAADLRAFLAAKLPGAVAFAIPKGCRDSAAMLQADMDAARAAWLNKAPSPQERQRRDESSFLKDVDAGGRVVDFHALRHTAGSLLAASGAHPKVAQSIMRHSTIELTMSRYTHVFAGQEADAVTALPDLAAPVAELAKMQATDNRPAVTDAVGCPRNDAERPGRSGSRPQSSAGHTAATSGNDGPTSRRVMATSGDGDGAARAATRRTVDSHGDGSMSVLADCLALSGNKSSASVDSDRPHASAGQMLGNPCKTGENAVVSVPQDAHGRVMELADIRDLKSRGAYGPVGVRLPPRPPWCRRATPDDSSLPAGRGGRDRRESAARAGMAAQASDRQSGRCSQWRAARRARPAASAPACPRGAGRRDRRGSAYGSPSPT